MPPNFYAIFTTIGLERMAEAQYSGVPLVFYQVAVGDGNGSPITPAVGMTALVHETARVLVNYVGLVSSEPTTVRVEGLIPAGTGGFTIREAGLFNEAGELLVIASYPPIYKPQPSDGVTADEYIRILLVYEAVEAVALTVDPSVVMATREYVDDADATLQEQIDTLDALALGFALGDGSDGPAVFDGTNTYPFASKSGSTYTLTRAPLTTDLTVNAGVELKGENFPIYSTGKVLNNGTMSCDGGAGGAASGVTPGAAGAAVTGGAFADAAAGGAGTYYTTGANGTSIAYALGGAGGGGGNMTAGASPGAGGTVTLPAADLGPTRTARAIMEGYVFDASGPYLRGLQGGAGGGGGTGLELFSVAGGGGGAGGGILAIACASLVNNGTIRANGGAGGAGGINGDIQAAGGGGAGGGRVGIVTGSLSGSGTIEALGGAAGPPASVSVAGTAPTAGANGQVAILNAASVASGPHLETALAIFAAVDHVDVVFSGGWAYQYAYGLDGYELDVGTPVLSADDYGGGVTVWVTNKTATGFTIQASDVCDIEVRWKALGY